MKKVVSEFIKTTYNCETGYAGGPRILYIKGERKQEALRAVRDKWPNLAFYVRAVDEIPEGIPVGESEVNPMEAYKQHVGRGTKPLKETVVEPLLAEAALTPVDSKQAAIELRAKVDEYLVKHQNNKNEKGFYTAAALFLNADAEYIRDRYRKLVKKGTIIVNTNTVEA